MRLAIEIGDRKSRLKRGEIQCPILERGLREKRGEEMSLRKGKERCHVGYTSSCHFMYRFVSQRLCNEDIAGSFCEQVIIPLKRVRASCVSLVSTSPVQRVLAITLSIHVPVV